MALIIWSKIYTQNKLWSNESPTANQIEIFACRFERPNPFAQLQQQPKKHHTQNLTSYIFDGYNYNRCMYIWAYFCCCCCCCSMWCVLFGSTVENHRCFFVHLSFILLCYGSLCVTVFMYEYVWRVALFLANRVGFLCALRRSVTFIYCFN